MQTKKKSESHEKEIRRILEHGGRGVYNITLYPTWRVAYGGIQNTLKTNDLRERTASGRFFGPEHLYDDYFNVELAIRTVRIPYSAVEVLHKEGDLENRVERIRLNSP